MTILKLCLFFFGLDRLDATVAVLINDGCNVFYLVGHNNPTAAHELYGSWFQTSKVFLDESWFFAFWKPETWFENWNQLQIGPCIALVGVILYMAAEIITLP